MKYKVTVPPTAAMGSYACTVRDGRYETKAKAALQDYNSARAHDGLDPVKRMPAGTFYAPCYEWAVQGLYSGTWEDECTEATRAEAKAQIACYRSNCPGTAFRFVRRPED